MKAVIILISILIAYLVIRRKNKLSNFIDTMSMLPYIMPGTVIGIALVIAFGRKEIALGTMFILLIALLLEGCRIQLGLQQQH